MLGFSAALIAHGRAEPHRALFMHYILPVLSPPGPAAAPPSLSSPVALALFLQGGRKQESFDGRKRWRISSPPEIKDKILQASPLLQPPLPGRPASPCPRQGEGCGRAGCHLFNTSFPARRVHGECLFLFTHLRAQSGGETKTAFIQWGQRGARAAWP